MARRAFALQLGRAEHLARKVVARLVGGTAARVDAFVSVGGRRAAADPDVVRRLGVTHVINLCAGDPGPHAAHAGVTYLDLAAQDRSDYPLDQHFDECLRFIRAAGAEDGHVLIHCRSGVSRSAAIALLHLVAHRGKTFDEALRRIRRVRPFAWPNAGFRALLRESRHGAEK